MMPESNDNLTSWGKIFAVCGDNPDDHRIYKSYILAQFDISSDDINNPKGSEHIMVHPDNVVMLKIKDGNFAFYSPMDELKVIFRLRQDGFETFNMDEKDKRTVTWLYNSFASNMSDEQRKTLPPLFSPQAQ